MKTLIFVLLFSTVALCQSVKTPEARRLEDVETAISKTSKQIVEAELKLRNLRSRYTDDVNEVKEKQKLVVTLTDQLAALNFERREILLKKMSKTLPNNQIELLKILIIQNERILDLLNTRLPALPTDPLR